MSLSKNIDYDFIFYGLIPSEESSNNFDFKDFLSTGYKEHFISDEAIN
jgi:hypothetical protein